jgi:predicted outer membrane protein
MLGPAFGPARASGPQDKSFLASAMQDDADLRTLSDLATKKVSDVKVRDLAKDLARMASSVDDELMPVARRDDVKPPGTLSLRASDQYSRIDAQSGRNAAQEFLRDVSIDARISEDDYAYEARSGEDPALKRLAAARAAQLEGLARRADSLRASLH